MDSFCHVLGENEASTLGFRADISVFILQKQLSHCHAQLYHASFQVTHPKQLRYENECRADLFDFGEYVHVSKSMTSKNDIDAMTYRGTSQLEVVVRQTLAWHRQLYLARPHRRVSETGNRI